MNLKIRDLLFPPRCALCDEVISPAEGGCCNECRKTLKYVSEPYCLKCGAPLKENEKQYCASCSVRDHLFTSCRALYEYAYVRTAIYRFKYSGRAEYADFFGREMAEAFREQLKRWAPQGLVPVPLYPAKQRIRGYNQAERLAEALSRYSGIPLFSKLVVRSRKTRPMKELNLRERQINLKNAFLIPQDVVKLEKVVVVDDIYTTGTTMDRLAGVLIEKGVREVYGLTLAIGSGI